MTRFIMSLEEAVDLVLFAFEHGENGDLLIQKAPACTIQTQAEAVCELFGGKKEDIKVIGIRHGEKMYETLLTNEECAKAVDLGNFYRVPADNRGLNYEDVYKRQVFVNPTYEETFPTTNLEARACQLPIVTYRTGGSPESSGEYGVVVECGNIEQLKREIISVCKAKNIAVSDCEGLDNQTVYGRYLDIYKMSGAC